MSVYAYCLSTEGVAQQDIGGFTSYPGERYQIFEVVRDLAAKSLHQCCAAVVNRFCLVAIEIDLANLFFQLEQRRFGVVRGSAMKLEKLGGDFYHQIISCLGSQYQGNEQF